MKNSCFPQPERRASPFSRSLLLRPLLCALFLLIAGTAPVCRAQSPELEPNDTMGTATPLVWDYINPFPLAPALSSAMSGRIFPAGDIDDFTFTVPGGTDTWTGTFHLDTGGPQNPEATSRNSFIALIDSDGLLVEGDDNDGWGTGCRTNLATTSGAASVISGVSLTAGATYWLVVSNAGVAGVISPYTLYAQLTSLAPAPESEPNGTIPIALGNPANPTVLATTGAVFGAVSGTIAAGAPADVDVFNITTGGPLMAGDVFVADLDCDPVPRGSSTDLRLRLWDPFGNNLIDANSSTSPTWDLPSAESFCYRVLQTGTYLLSVEPIGTAAGDYTLRVTRHRTGTLGLSAETYCADENSGSVTITVERTGGGMGIVSVDFATTNFSAQAGSDYVATNGTLVFTNGVSSVSFTVSILDDGIAEPNEAFGVVLSNPSNFAGVGPISDAVVGIIDNDELNNNSSATAIALDLRGGLACATGAISPAGDLDYYSFALAAGAWVWIGVDTGAGLVPCANSRDSRVTLLASDGVTVIETDDNDGSGNGCASFLPPGGENASVIAGRGLAPGTYYIRVEEASGANVIDPYQLVVVTNGLLIAEIAPNSVPPLSIYLSGPQEMPANNSPAVGSGGLRLGPFNSLYYNIPYSGLTGNFTEAHLHGPAGVGENGPIIFNLSNIASNTRAGRLSGATPSLSSAQIAALQAGSNYINIHSMAFPGGEIRGQVYVQGAWAGQAHPINFENSPISLVFGRIGNEDADSGELILGGDVDDYFLSVLPGSILSIIADCDPEKDGTNTDLTLELLDGDGLTRLFLANSSTPFDINSSNLFLAEGFCWAVTNPPSVNFVPLFVRVTATGSGTYMLSFADKHPGLIDYEFSQRFPCAPLVNTNETAPQAIITAARKYGTFGQVTVNFATSDGSAFAGADYLATNGTLTFASGVSRAAFTVPIINDSLPEFVESVNLRLSNPTGGALLANPPQLSCPFSILPGDPLQAQLFIVDDDEVPNNSSTNAPRLDVSLPVAQVCGSLSIPTGDSWDIFCFTNRIAGARAWIWVQTWPPTSPYFSIDSVVSLLNSTNGLVEMDDDDGSSASGTPGLASAIAGATLTNTGNFYVRVSVYDPQVSGNKPPPYSNSSWLPILDPYWLDVIVTTNVPIPEVEPNNTNTTANPLLTTNSPVGLRCGTLDPANTANVDFYSLYLQAGDRAIIIEDGNPERDLSTNQTYIALDLLGTNGSTILYHADSSRSGVLPAEPLSFVATNTGTYFVRVGYSPFAPHLSTTYYLMGTRDRPLLVTPRISGSDVILTFPTLLGRNYQVEASDDLLVWSAISGIIAGTGGTTSYTDVGGAGRRARYYRLGLLP